MTIDERLEALTQSLELLASLHKDNEQRNEEMRQALTKARSGRVGANHAIDDAEHGCNGGFHWSAWRHRPFAQRAVRQPRNAHRPARKPINALSMARNRRFRN